MNIRMTILRIMYVMSLDYNACVHHFNVAVAGGAKFKYFIYCWVV